MSVLCSKLVSTAPKWPEEITVKGATLLMKMPWLCRWQ